MGSYPQEGFTWYGVLGTLRPIATRALVARVFLWTDLYADARPSAVTLLPLPASFAR